MGKITEQELNTSVVAKIVDATTHIPYAATTGSANTYAITLNPVPASYVDGMAVSVKINVDSTAASTLNINALGTKALKSATGSDITNLKTNGVYTFRYNSTTGNFILQGEGVDATPLITAQNAIFGM